jgi:phenylpyruvate tautomerase PptA (4-oxalocrotonate tautomerase family)
MPFYRCISLAGSLSQEQKEEIVREVTRIHCQETGGLPRFVQILFDEVTSDNVFQNGKPSSAIRLHARIRAGRDAATKLRMLRAYTDSSPAWHAFPLTTSWSDSSRPPTRTSWKLASAYRLPARKRPGSLNLNSEHLILHS